MKKAVTIILIGLIVIGMVLVLTGCGSNKEDISEVNELKEKVENIISNMKLPSSIYNTKEMVEAGFLSYSRDLYLELEELDNKGKSYILKYGSDMEQIPENIRNNDEVFCVYIASEKHSDVWTYGTAEINTGKISWHDNY